jgi:hypothetical protein
MRYPEFNVLLGVKVVMIGLRTQSAGEKSAKVMLWSLDPCLCCQRNDAVIKYLET